MRSRTELAEQLLFLFVNHVNFRLQVLMHKRHQSIIGLFIADAVVIDQREVPVARLRHNAQTDSDACRVDIGLACNIRYLFTSSWTLVYERFYGTGAVRERDCVFVR